MTRIIITDWRHGLITIDLIRFLRDSCGFGLREAKLAVDGLISNSKIAIQIDADQDSVALILHGLESFEVEFVVRENG